MLLWTAFTLGLLGSLHCVGMCGPLMLAMPTPQESVARVGRILLYQVGRISSYAFLGFTLGWLGWGASLWNSQNTLAILSGVLLLGLAIFQIDLGNVMLRFPAFGRFQLFLRRQFARLFKESGWSSYLGVGALNGFLPCGLVYVAILGAINAGHPLLGAAFMLFFGLGTTPLLLATVWLGGGQLRRWGLRLPSWTPIIIALVGIFLIWRGGQIHLPADFIFWQGAQEVPMCH